ncbi:ATP-binding domain-containing protein [Streptantibioticus cattleyicolor]|uniref:ATP-binding domain-containing protein n=1 Tax=Streptantibioticus cattleyicolor TaxID=29303 RepID=UPI00389A4BBA
MVLTALQAKGLEFDSVLIADPQAIRNGSPRGLNDLYVALTRATRRLAILHPGPAPAQLARTVRPREPSRGGEVRPERRGRRGSDYRPPSPAGRR